MSEVSAVGLGVCRWACLCACVVFVACTGVAAGAPSPEHPFSIEPGSFQIVPSTLQAGAHEDLTTTFNFAHSVGSKAEKVRNDLRTTVVNLPPGFIGSATAVPTCSDAQLHSTEIERFRQVACPPDTQVGLVSFDLHTEGKVTERFTVPVFNMESNTGVAATLGFSVVGIVTQILPVSVRPGETALTVTSPNIEVDDEPHAVSFTIWGVPASPEHNAQRGLERTETFRPGLPPIVATHHPGGEEVNLPIKPFIANPTRCTTSSLIASMSADSWEEPFIKENGEWELEKWPHATAEIGPLTGCERVPFHPYFEAQPTTTSAESPTGLDATLTVPQTWEDPETLSSADVDDTRVTLPEGITVNPSAGSGLGSCTPQQLEKETAFSLSGEGCPPESKIGSIEIETPLISEKIDGAVYIATPYDNPFGSLLALYIVAKNHERGILIRVAGKVEPNPVTGQLVTTFDETPQAPFNRFVLKFRGGATAPLVSPPACGSYNAVAELTPWSAPLEPRLAPGAPFEIAQGVGGGACPTGGVPPFSPQLTAGSVNNAAGSYSPLYIRIERHDGEQEITGFSTALPPGLTGNLNGVPYCGEAEIAAARAQTGQQAEESPACPAASQIGHSIAEAGVGTVLAQTPGRLYLAGPFEGAPFSVVSVTSAKVGPFDLGTVVLHLPLDINPETAQVTIPAGAADQIPHIIAGIVIHLRTVRVYIDREHFMLNPTNCDPMSLSGTVIGGGADPTNPAANDPVTATDRFQAADCAGLKFAPKLAVSTSAHASKANGASLHVSVTYPPNALGNDANIKYVKVALPKALPSRLTTLQKACLAKVFAENPAKCPPESTIGTAKAVTPILPVPLNGPVYFVSNGGEAFPNLVIVLQGDGVTIRLVGDTFISKAGVTSSTFKSIPDQPVTSFELDLPVGPYSALTAIGNLCTQKLVVPNEFVSQAGGDPVKQNSTISVTGCAPAITVVGAKVRGKTATIQVSVPAAGKLVATAKGLSKASKTAKAATTLTLKLILTHAEAAFLGKHKTRKLKAKVNLTFTPKSGAKLKTSTTVMIG